MTYYVNGREKEVVKSSFEWTLTYRNVNAKDRDPNNDDLPKFATYAGTITVTNKNGKSSFSVYGGAQCQEPHAKLDNAPHDPLKEPN